MISSEIEILNFIKPVTPHKKQCLVGASCHILDVFQLFAVKKKRDSFSKLIMWSY